MRRTLSKVSQGAVIYADYWAFKKTLTQNVRQSTLAMNVRIRRSSAVELWWLPWVLATSLRRTGVARMLHECNWCCPLNVLLLRLSNQFPQRRSEPPLQFTSIVLPMTSRFPRYSITHENWPRGRRRHLQCIIRPASRQTTTYKQNQTQLQSCWLVIYRTPLSTRPSHRSGGPIVIPTRVSPKSNRMHARKTGDCSAVWNRFMLRNFFWTSSAKKPVCKRSHAYKL